MFSGASIISQKYSKKLSTLLSSVKQFINGNNGIDSNSELINNIRGCETPIQTLYDCLVKFSNSLNYEVDIYNPDNSNAIKECLEIMNFLTLSDVGLENINLNNIGQSACMSILSTDKFELAVFILPKGLSLPLHDHPNMSVLSKVIKGNLQVQGFSPIVENSNYYMYMNDKKFQLNKVLKLGDELETIATDNCVKSVQDSAWYLSPNRSNIHQFKALETCVVFDVLVPPYIYPNRPCNYFEISSKSTDERFTLKVIPEPDSKLPVAVYYNGYKPVESKFLSETEIHEHSSTN